MSNFAFVIKFFQNKNFHGGGEKVFFKLIEFLSQNGHSIDVYCSQTNVEYMENVNIYLVNAPYNHLKPNVIENFYEKVKEMIEDKNYDHIISENFTPPLDITIIHGHSIKHRMNFKPLFSKLLYNFRKVKVERMKAEEKYMKQGYNKIFAVSEIQKKDFIENLGAKPETVSILPLAHDGMKEFNEKTYNQNSQITFGASMIGFNTKGGYTLINALKYLKNFDYKVKIIYPKWKKNLGLRILLKLWNLEKKVEFLQKQQDMDKFYNSIDVMLIPSREDTFNLTTLEAMSRGIVPVISNRAGAFEILQHAKDGFIFNFDKNNDKNLAEILKLILSNPQILNDMKKNTYKTAEKYQWQNMFERFLELIK